MVVRKTFLHVDILLIVHDQGPVIIHFLKAAGLSVNPTALTECSTFQLFCWWV